MSRFLFLRHGQSEWNAIGRWQGWADPGLSPLGRLQAEHAGKRLVDGDDVFGAVVSSDLARSFGTAEILASVIGLDPPQADPGLREFNIGEWSGLTRVEIEARWPGDLDRWRQGKLDQMPGGETRRAFEARIFGTLAALAARNAGGAGTGAVLVVTHGGVIDMIERRIGAPVDRERLSNLRGRWFDIDGEQVMPGPEVVLLDPEVDSPPITPVP